MSRPQLAPGIELDQAVARALGAEYLGDIRGRFGVHTWRYPFALPGGYDWRDLESDSTGRTGILLPFSENANCALLAAERFQPVKAWTITLMNGFAGVECDMRRGGLIEAPVRITDDLQLPHAICLAIVSLQQKHGERT